MPKIDKMLRMMQDRGVERAVIIGDKPFQIYSGASVVEGSVTPAAQLLELLEEIVPPANLPQLRGGGTFHFRHNSVFGVFDCGVENFVGTLQVSIAAAKSQLPLSPALDSPPVTPSPIANVKRELYVHHAGRNIGPMTPEDAANGLRSGQYLSLDLAIAPHMKTWDSLQNVLEFFGAAPPTSISPAPVAPMPFSPLTSAAPLSVAPMNAALRNPPVMNHGTSSGMSTATHLLRSFSNEEQDPAAVARVIERLQQLCTPEETILYIAVQKKPVVTVAPISVALTTKRVIIFRPKALGLGLTFEDHLWRTVVDIHISEAILGSTFSLKLTGNSGALVDSLPKAQARKLYQFGQQMEEHMHSHRRDLMLEEKRAGAGGVSVSVNNAPPVAPLSAATTPNAAEDPVEKLQKLKTMLDRGLISQQDYDAKKTEIMSRF